MIRECFLEALQGERWRFRKHLEEDKVIMEDTLGQFKDVEMSMSMGEILSQQLGILQQYQNNDRRQLLIPNLILDFVKENRDIDKDIIIALIENITYGSD